MKKYARDRRPYVRPVTRLELSASNIKIRWILIALLLAAATVALGYGFSLILGTEPGWQEVNTASDTLNCGADFVLMYDFSAGDVNPTAQSQKLETLYTELTEKSYQLFSPNAKGSDNLYYVNQNINRVVTVDPILYHALEQIAEAENRHVFLGPVRELYDAVFLSGSDGEAALYDPMKEPGRAALARETAAYCADPAMVGLELLGENQVCLNVAQEYLAFAQEYGITIFLDFGWMTNAFIIDYIAQELAAQGHVYGYISSHDGYTRNLDIRSNAYSQNIFHWEADGIYMPAVMEYTGPMSLVTLRNYPVSEQDQWNYYAYEDGSITSVYLDPLDGVSKSSIDAVTVYSREAGCAQLVLQIAPLFTADTFASDGLEALESQGIHSVYCQNKGVVYTEETAVLNITDEGYEKYFHGIK